MYRERGSRGFGTPFFQGSSVCVCDGMMLLIMCVYTYIHIYIYIYIYIYVYHTNNIVAYPGISSRVSSSLCRRFALESLTRLSTCVVFAATPLVLTPFVPFRKKYMFICVYIYVYTHIYIYIYIYICIYIYIYIHMYYYRH